MTTLSEHIHPARLSGPIRPMHQLAAEQVRDGTYPDALLAETDKVADGVLDELEAFDAANVPERWEME